MKKGFFLQKIDYFSGCLFLYALILLFSYSVEGFLFLEWVISFSPYFIVFSFLIFVLGVVKKKGSTRSLPFIISITFVVTATIITGQKIFNFTTVLPQFGEGSKVIKIAFFNKYLYNSNYNAINQAISRVNPDVLGFTEITDADLKGIKELKRYPYKSLRIGKDYFSFALFSLYPLDVSKTEKSIFASKLQFNNVYYNVALVHPLPPVSFNDLSIRNNKLSEIKEYIDKAGSQTILMGDFNTTPWSRSYDSLTKNLKLKNAAKGMGLNFTWGFPLQAQIDHIFVPDNSVIESFKVEYVDGSDHRLIWAQLKL